MSEASDRRPLSRMRRAIAEAMTLSAQIPQFTLERAADLGPASQLRAELAEAGGAVSLQDFFVAACARALRRHPEVNASFDGDAIVVHPRVHVGFALALPAGLVSPAILDADRRGLAGLAVERVRLSEAARGGKLAAEELYGSTFTVSNLGPFGVERFRALVTPPQAAILAVGAIDRSDSRPRAWLSLSCDHRVLDGAPAAAFLNAIVDGLEHPGGLDR